MKKAPKILTIKSDKTELLKVEKFLSEIYKEKGLPLRSFNKVLLCISEAVINSIDHGNRNDTTKKVSIEISCFGNKYIDIKIRDEGEGFDYRNVDNPTITGNIKKETGRGIHIIKSLCDEFEFKNRGNCVRFKLSVSE